MVMEGEEEESDMSEQQRSDGGVLASSTGLPDKQDTDFEGTDNQVRTLWKLRMRGPDDDLPQ